MGSALTRGASRGVFRVILSLDRNGVVAGQADIALFVVKVTVHPRDVAPLRFQRRIKI